MTDRALKKEERSLRMVCLGSSDAFNSGGRAHSCYWVEDHNGVYLLDCGPTTPQVLRREQERGRIDPRALDVIYLTHLHGDHIAGLPVLLLTFSFAYQRKRALLIAGPKTTQERVETLCEAAYPGIKSLLSYSLSFHERELDSEDDATGRTLKSIEANHDAASYPTSIRLTDSLGRSLVFSGDTGWNHRLIELSAGASALVLECSYETDEFSGHISLTEVRRIRSDLTPTQLILTHFGEASRAAAIKSRSELDLCVADDGMEWLIDT